MATLTFQTTPKQDELYKAVKDGKGFVLYGGAIRGGKTYGALAILFGLCLRYPGSRWAIVRKDLPTIRRNLLPTYNKLRAEMGVESIFGAVNQSSWDVELPNGSRLIFFSESIKDDPDLNRWRGLEVNGFLLEEANELSEASFEKAMERRGSWLMDGVPSPIIMTANPCKNWLKGLVYDRWKAGTLPDDWAYIPATPTDNPHLSDEYKENLLALKDKNPVAYAKFVEGDWDVSEGDTFKEAMFRWHDGADPREHTLMVFADIAYTKKKTSDYCAIGLCGIDPVGTKRWFETNIERMDEDESIAYLIRKAKEYTERGFDVPYHIEAHSSYIKLLEQRARLEGVKMHIEPLKHGGVSKVDRILSTRAGLSMWEFDRGSQQLVNQFLDWSPELIDVLPDDGADMHAYADTILKWNPNQKSSWNRKPPTDPTLRRLWEAQRGKPKHEDRRPQGW